MARKKRTRAEKRAGVKRFFKGLLWFLGNVVTFGQMIKNKRGK